MGEWGAEIEGERLESAVKLTVEKKVISWLNGINEILKNLGIQ